MTRLRGSARGLVAIINDILDASKLEAGQMTIEAVEFEFHDVIHQAVGLRAPKAEEKGLALSCDIDAPLCSRFHGEPTRLRQLINLIGNAIKFTAEGSVAVTARRLDAQGEETIVRIEVADTGIGICQTGKAKLFENFSQADDAGKHEEEKAPTQRQPAACVRRHALANLLSSLPSRAPEYAIVSASENVFKR